MDPYRWSWNPEALLLVPLMTAGYVLAFRRFPAPPWRIACFVTAMVTLLVVTITPLETIAMNYLLVIHLLQNVVLAEWAPLLVVLGLPPALAATLSRPRAVRTLTHPAVALPLWLANYMLWHLPWLYDTALENPHTLLHLEHALYFATGVAMWWSVVQDAPHRLGTGIRAGVVFAAFILGSPIGLVLALVPDAVYDFYVEAPERLWGLSALEDQQLAGILMALEQAVVFFAVFTVLFLRFLTEEERREDFDHRGAP
ncbi:MAG: cytochrome c oxidase assembly protein [Actinomycetota bacterium]|nr:cytochrome c oxidase assembly protein [Actinomycetota bacterium]